MRVINRRYLEGSVGLALVHSEAVCLKVFDGHVASQVFSVAHVSGPAVAVNVPETYELPLKNI